ncbi:T9SS type A sorting domain-containing protein [Empedobacter tilapiae]|uniref:T9SS type A sorting domain-containing protein n=1 Tax=Empedobacter tilapiae TaxID=2491114 RepID=A0A4Z1B329_9FLAO|nr:T9SS type A sorting domain-containing protein [Empedobacter tilapiae]TGN21944.1 T9SS type A sorting domain-containing protein [Empedobacter tilapiae]
MKKTLLSIFSLFPMLIISAQQDVLWEKSIGGENAEYLYHAISTPDYGFILLGSSGSNFSKNIDNLSEGGLDYFISKLDENGKQEWQHTFGGSGNDFLYAAVSTPDGGILLAGSSDSDKGRDKTENSKGLHDYWVIKLDAGKNIQWQKTLGGTGNDFLRQVIRTHDGGYLLAGESNSGKSFDKSEIGFGGFDYWLIKLDSKGNIVWEKTIGGNLNEEVKYIQETKNGFILLGNTNSIDETTIQQDNGFDVEMIILTKKGEVESRKKIISTQEDDFLHAVDEKNDHLNLLISTNENDKSQLVILEVDKNGSIHSEIRKELNNKFSINSLFKLENNDFLIAGSQQGFKKDQNIIPTSFYTIFSLDINGAENWRKELKESGYNDLQFAFQTRDQSIILIGNSNSKNTSTSSNQDFRIIKLGNKNSEIKRELVELYPNPTSDYINLLIQQGIEPTTGSVYNLTGQKLQDFKINSRTTAIDLRNYPSGIYIIQFNVDKQSHSIKVIKK